MNTELPKNLSADIRPYFYRSIPLLTSIEVSSPELTELQTYG